VSKSRVVFFISLVLVLALLGSAIACSSSSATTTATTQPAATTTQPAATTTQPAATTTQPGATTATTTAPASNIKKGGKLTVIYPYMGTSLGWPAESLGGYQMYQQLCLETLLQEEMDGTITYRLATGYTVAEDLTSITFTLRQGVKFHDGSDFNADVVKFNLEQLMAKKKHDTSFFKSVDILDTYTVRINLNSWINWLVDDFANAGNMYMVSKAAYEKNGAEWMKNNMVGTGPFMVKDWQQDDHLSLVKNPNYWQEGKPYLDELEILVVGDGVTAQATFLAGDADILQSEADQKAADLIAKGTKAALRMVGVANMFPDSRTATSPLSKLKVRQAVNYALDLQTLSKTVCGGLASAAYQMAPPNVPAYDPNIEGYRYNPEKAKALLAEAGYPNGIDITIYPCPVTMFNDMAVALQSDLKKVGINAKVELITDAKFGELVTQPSQNALILAGVSSCVPNWAQALSLFFNPKGILFPSMDRSEAYTAAYMAAANSPTYDNAKVQALLKQINDDAMVTPLFNTQEAWLYQDYVKGAWDFWPAGLQMWAPENTWLDK